MKANLLKISLVAGALAIAAGNLSAQETNAAAPQLSYGVDQVVQLSKASISEGTIISYVQNSGNNFNLDANQIIYLKDQGVSASVINAMINQRNRPGAAASVASTTGTMSETVTTVQPTVTSVPTSTVYVIPDTQTYYYDTYSYPYYYYGWPAVSLSFGWGGHWGGGYHGGWHGGGGGWHGGGGFHSGGYHGGGFHGGGGWHH